MEQQLPMRILFWTETFWPHIGGVEVLSTRLIVALRDRGHDLMVITREDLEELPQKTNYLGIPVYRFPFWKALADGMESLAEVRQQVLNLKRSFAPDVVHINAVGPGVFFQLCTAKACPAPTLVTLHGGWRARDLRRDSLLGNALRAADWVSGVSAAVLSAAHPFAPEIPARSSVIYNGLDAPALSPEPLPTDPPRLLCLGRVEREKGFDLALQALRALRDRFLHLRMVIAGDGLARADLQQQAAALGLTEVVDFRGWVAPKEVPALMNSATVVLTPSRDESFNLVALEAALMARPVVATRVGGLPEVVASGHTGLLVDKEDSAALAAAIGFLLDHPERATEMGWAARRRAQEVFSFARCVDGYEARYRKMINGGVRC